MNAEQYAVGVQKVDAWNSLLRNGAGVVALIAGMTIALSALHEWVYFSIVSSEYQLLMGTGDYLRSAFKWLPFIVGVSFIDITFITAFNKLSYSELEFNEDKKRWLCWGAVFLLSILFGKFVLASPNDWLSLAIVFVICGFFVFGLFYNKMTFIASLALFAIFIVVFPNIKAAIITYSILLIWFLFTKWLLNDELEILTITFKDICLAGVVPVAILVASIGFYSARYDLSASEGSHTLVHSEEAFQTSETEVLLLHSFDAGVLVRCPKIEQCPNPKEVFMIPWKDVKQIKKLSKEFTLKEWLKETFGKIRNLEKELLALGQEAEQFIKYFLPFLDFLEWDKIKNLIKSFNLG